MRFDASLDVCDKRISLAHPPTHCAYEVVQNVITVAINSIVEVRDWKIHKSRVNISALNESSTQYDQPCLSRVFFVKFLSFLKKHLPKLFLAAFVCYFVCFCSASWSWAQIYHLPFWTKDWVHFLENGNTAEALECSTLKMDAGPNWVTFQGGTGKLFGCV